MIKHSIAAISLMAASYSMAVEVVDSQPLSSDHSGRNGSYDSRRDAPPPPPPQGTAQKLDAVELYYQMQALQQEVMELRGLVEQQSYDIKKLKQQRLDDYIDLDRRISSLGTGAATPTKQASNSSASSNSGFSASAGTVDELTRYRTAIDLVLKKRDYEEGIKALKEYLNDFPDGQHAGNSQYWLGQLYLQKNELQTSLEWFDRMVKAFPDHRKASEAKFKLGKVHHLMGNKAEAEGFLKEVAKSQTAAAALAKDYLAKNF